MIQAREALLSDLSHELRSPLARMQVSTEFIEKPELRENIKDDLREMESMVSEVLEGARLSSPHAGLETKELNLSELLSALTSKYDFQKPGVVFVSRLEPGYARIIADEERLRSAIRNLVENALKYSSHQDKPVEVTLGTHKDGVEITVLDHGVGIPQSEQTRVFEPFYRVDKSRTRSTGGYGLGLNLCKKVIEAHGGTISLSSTPGQGSLFKVWLPSNQS
jgi:signal transduction histidine kinase